MSLSLKPLEQLLGSLNEFGDKKEGRAIASSFEKDILPHYREGKAPWREVKKKEIEELIHSFSNSSSLPYFEQIEIAKKASRVVLRIISDFESVAQEEKKPSFGSEVANSFETGVFTPQEGDRLFRLASQGLGSQLEVVEEAEESLLSPRSVTGKESQIALSGKKKM